MKGRRLCLVLLLLCFSLSCLAQTDGLRLDFGSLVEGYLDGLTPREVFVMDGWRGEVIQFELRAVSGDLAPALGVFDETGTVQFYRHGEGHIQRRLTLQANGRYFVVVGRFGQALGTTAGRYELRLTRLGILSQEGSVLRVGDAVIDAISDDRPQVYYGFQAHQGGILTISMIRASGTLDPYVQVVSSEGLIIAENDDQVGVETRNARIDALIIEEAGLYIILAGRYGGKAGDSAGSFVLRLEEAENSGTGNLAAAPLPIRYAETKSGALDHRQHQRFYAFDAQRNDRVTIRMMRTSPGELDSYLILADADYAPLAEDDDGGRGQDAQILDYRIPAAGKYHIIATRYEGSGGTTIGHYQLALESLGDAFAGADPDALSISYGARASGDIGDADAEDLYVFYARQGETISISMTRGEGNLDPALDLLDSAQGLLLSDDDSGPGQSALIDDYVIPESGLYYIRARRYADSRGDPDTAGSYVLVLAQRFE